MSFMRCVFENSTVIELTSENCQNLRTAILGRFSELGSVRSSCVSKSERIITNLVVIQYNGED